MPVLKKIGAEADTFGEWLLAAARHWRALLTGPGLSLGVLVYSLATNKPIPPHWYVWMMLVGVPIAFYFAWREEHRKATVSPDVESLYKANALELASLRLQLARLTPRGLSDSQKDCLRQRLKPLTDWMRTSGKPLQIMVSAENEGWDSADYARAFEDFLESLTFKVSRYALSGTHIGDDYRRGVWFRWSTEREKEYVFPFGQKFVDALKGCGIDVTPSDHPDWQFYELVIGARRVD